MYVKKLAIFSSLLLIGIMGYFCSCASASASGKKQLFAYLTNNSKYILLPPEGIENPMDMVQQISASYGDNDYFFIAWVKANKTGIDITLLNEFGANMGELSYRDGEVFFSSLVFPGSVKPEYVVADFQLCFYNAQLLRDALKDCGLSIEDTDTGRRILQKGTVIIEIEKNSGFVRLVNHLRGYAYTLEGEFSGR